MHFSPPKLHLSKSNASLSSSQRGAGRSEHGEDRPVQVKEPPREREAATKKEEEEEEVSEWIEGQDVVIERKSCVPGEDVQVEVLRGAAANLNGRDHHQLVGGMEEVKKAKERLRKRGKEEEEREVGGVFGKCMEVLQHHGHAGGHPSGAGVDGQRD
ncbi:hypothetical protein ACEPAG_3077 [Sanghuangporus baumii]